MKKIENLPFKPLPQEIEQQQQQQQQQQQTQGLSQPTPFNPFTATGYFDIPPPPWPTFLAMLFPILKEGMGLSLLVEFEVQYHVIIK